MNGAIEAPVSDLIADALILIVDDEVLQLELLGGLLRRAGFRNLHFAESGEAALDAAFEAPPDLVLLDVMMPGIDGYETCRRVRASKDLASIPVVIQTAADDRDSRREAFRCGGTDIVTKPVDAYELVARVALHIERRMMVEKLQRQQERLAMELCLAREMQDALLPSPADAEAVSVAFDVQLGHYSEPATELAGDFWGVRRINTDCVAVYIVDFAGHGVNAALNTFRLHTMLSEFNELDVRPDDPGRFLTSLNARLAPILATGQFATMLYAVIDVERREIAYGAAGSPSPILTRPGHEPELLDGSGLPLGAIRDATYKTRSCSFPRGSSLLLYSDALTETPCGGARLGVPGLRDLVSSVAGNSAQETVDNIMREFGNVNDGVVDDDLTLVCLEASASVAESWIAQVDSPVRPPPDVVDAPT